MRKLDEARNIALRKGIISNKDQLQISQSKGKRFVLITNDGKRVNFGLWPFTGDGSFLDHGNNDIKKAWQARHSKIKLKDGRFSYKVKNTPEYLSWNILW